MSILKALLYTVLLFVIGVILSFGFQSVIALLDLNLEYLIHYNSVTRILTKILQYSVILFLAFKLWFAPSYLLLKIKKIKWETVLLILIVSIGFEIFAKIFLELKVFLNDNKLAFESINHTDYKSEYFWRYDLIRAVILAPILEELFFRKILFTRMLKKYSFGISAIVSSICFAFIHIPNWLNLVPTFLFGIISCWIYVKTKNILYPILLHFVGNLIVLLLSFHNQQITSFLQELNYSWVYWLILISGVGMTLFGLRKLKKAPLD
ncbi:type II CAAX endopeptidase family protein [Marivirga sp.]|uniref:CPBP family intramembrane glutamic endopeptidase n=1 Tax=Marivirga sp. TaxID=2018662 RepID=UPI002D8034C6|nr:type II CAAX endopeptidase family protein [Marivirga sp.]HET8860235.1 type II CAAX endopeptidase family protein [Marivirga sp.]